MPSIITPMGESKELSSDRVGLMPRIVMLAPPPPRLPSSLICTLGAKPFRSVRSRMDELVSSSEIAVMATGTSWEDSSTFRAVTTTSSIDRFLSSESTLGAAAPNTVEANKARGHFSRRAITKRKAIVFSPTCRLRVP